MRLRTTILLLSLTALISLGVGGVSYYFSLRESALAVAQRRGEAAAEMIRNQLASSLVQNSKPSQALAGLNVVQNALSDPSRANLDRVNEVLDYFQESLDVDVCYLLDRTGTTVASSNRHSPDSFVGHNFAFRPYFRESMAGRSAKYMALGTASNRRGAYYSHPVFGTDSRDPLGVMVIKAPISVMEKNIIQSSEGVTMLVGPHHVIFSSNKQDWLYKILWKPEPADLRAISASRQFGDGPWPWVGLSRREGNAAVDQAGNEYLLYSKVIHDFPGWRVVHLADLKDISRSLFDPLVRTTGWLMMALCLLGGVGVYFLYRKASREISRRKVAEYDLRESEKRYRTLYHNTPAPLCSLDQKGRLLTVSDFWVETLGYTRGEALGSALTDYLAPDSRRVFLDKALPEFFASGRLKDTLLTFVKRDGSLIEALVSAVVETDEAGRFQRGLAVLVDITDRRRAEEELRLAKEMLDHYSKDLERQVSERTKEITGFIQHTPAVVYMKDTDLKYIMVNSRHESLFGQSGQDVKGKTVYDVFPREIADQFWRNDLKVLKEKRPIQAEELFEYGGQRYTYLSVRFPVLDEVGKIIRLCGISVNITDIKNAQNQLRRLSGNILAGQEKERTAIARELHDELGQVLTALRIEAVWLRDRFDGQDQRASQRAGNMCDLIDSTIIEVRNIATRLRPAVLDDLGLVDALEWHTADFEKRTGITTSFIAGEVPDLNEIKSIAAYRVAQEAMTNVARHAGAARVSVRLLVEEQTLVLEVSDDGTGFAVEDLAEARELGIAGMRERALLAGGELFIRSQPGQGTEVEMRLPLQRG